MGNPFRRRPIDLANCSIVEWSYARTGSMVKAARVNAFVILWGLARAELGRSPTVEEYAAYTEESNATAYRHQALFRDVFGLETPDPLLDVMEAHRAASRERFDLTGLVVA